MAHCGVRGAGTSISYTVELRVRRVGWHGRGMPPARSSPVNATAAALLGLLHEGPMTGGQLVAAAGEQLRLVLLGHPQPGLPGAARAGRGRPAQAGQAGPAGLPAVRDHRGRPARVQGRG